MYTSFVRLKVSQEIFENKKMFMTVLERECENNEIDVDKPYEYIVVYEGDDFIMNTLTVIVTQRKKYL